MNWKILDTGKRSADENMQIDAELLWALQPQGEPILHFYEWSGACATFGYFTKIDRFFDIPKAKKIPLHFARRPTGGGIVFHIWDFAFSVLLPSGHKKFSSNTLDNYQLINQAVLEGVKDLFTLDFNLLSEDPKDESESKYFCMAKPTIYDVMLGGKKIAGAAQRKQKQGFLHQGSISLAAPKIEMLEEILLPGAKVLDAMQQTSYYVLGPNWKSKELEQLRQKIRARIQKTITEI